MLDRLKRLESIAGMPAKVKHADPTDFYKELESTSHNLINWKGELYFELHRGIIFRHS
jgi:alpha-mannosidase